MPGAYGLAGEIKDNTYTPVMTTWGSKYCDSVDVGPYSAHRMGVTDPEAKKNRRYAGFCREQRSAEREKEAVSR